MKPFKEKNHKMKNLLLLLIVFTACTSSFSQNSYSSTIKFNVPVGGKITNSGGLEVKCSMPPTTDVSLKQATLDEQPDKYLKKKIFTLFITVTNTGKNNIIISDWHFQAICPENNHGQQWQETSFINLITPFIPNTTNILLKPGEKKSFYTTKTDFFWCSPKHQAALMTPPCGLTALIICKQVGNPIYNNGLTNDFSGNNCKYENYDDLPVTVVQDASGTTETDKSNGTANIPETSPLDSELLALIDEFKKAQASGNSDEANEYKKSIMEIAGHAYPNRIDEIKALLQQTPLKDKPITPNSMKTVTTNNLDFSDWLTIKNPYYAMQIRYKLEKQQGDIGYFRAQMRIDFDDKDRCKDSRCLGYAVSFGYPTLEGSSNIYLNYKFYYSYKDIYTVPDLIAIKLLLPDGSKRLLKQDGFYYTNANNSQEMDLRYYFDKAVDLILEGSPIKVNNYIESKAIILN